MVTDRVSCRPKRAGYGVPMSRPEDLSVRIAEEADAEVIGRLLHDFNTEFEDPTPSLQALATRVRALLAADEITVMLGGSGLPLGLAVLRFRPAIFSESLDCYLEELYVVPDFRGHGLGRSLMDAAIDTARRCGANRIELGTSEDDHAARALYEKLGFTNRENGPDGPVMFFYERDL